MEHKFFVGVVDVVISIEADVVVVVVASTSGDPSVPLTAVGAVDPSPRADSGGSVANPSASYSSTGKLSDSTRDSSVVGSAVVGSVVVVVGSVESDGASCAGAGASDSRLFPRA